MISIYMYQDFSSSRIWSMHLSVDTTFQSLFSNQDSVDICVVLTSKPHIQRFCVIKLKSSFRMSEFQ